MLVRAHPRLASASDRAVWCVGEAYLTLFEVASLDMWAEVMYHCMDIKGEGQQPETDSSWYYAYFYLLFVVFGSLFMLQLVVSVVVRVSSTTEVSNEWCLQVDMYDREGVVQGPQAEFSDLEKLVTFLSPIQLPKRPKNNRLRKLCYDICLPWDAGRLVNKDIKYRSLHWLRMNFDAIVTWAVGLNLLILCTRTYDMDASHERALDVLDAFFVCFYIVELLIRVMAYRPHVYFRDTWNCVDAFVVFMSGVSIFIGGKFARLFRVLRVLRLLKNITIFNMITTVMLQSVLRVWNIVCVLLMLMLSWGILGIEAFGDLRYGVPCDRGKYPILCGRRRNCGSAYKL